jgi:succinate dehydrogenase/fumarate reductase flavoprotein subunit
VLGGGPAGAWAAITAREAGAEVVLADKGFFGTSGATAPSNTETWCVPPGPEREAAICRQLPKSLGLAEPEALKTTLTLAWNGLHRMIDWKYPFPPNAAGKPYLGNLRGPDYMRFMRRHAIGAGVRVLDHHPALEFLADASGVGGAVGIDRQFGRPWRARASAVVLATGGCAFGERILGATGLTGDGYLLAAEAGISLTGMEFSSQYAVAPLHSSISKGMPYRWATFYDCDGHDLGNGGDDRQTLVAHAMRKGPVYASLDRAGPDVQRWLRAGQPNCFLAFDRNGIDPFTERFPVALRAEGTVRGTGGIKVDGLDCNTGVDGLFAAGDVASRQHMSGAVTGGGGPNSSWAIASGQIAGRAAATHARAMRRSRDARRLEGLGEAGLRPRSGAKRSASAGLAPHDVISEVRRTMLPPETNFARSDRDITTSRNRLNGVWSELRDGLGSDAHGRLKPREAAALVAASRWVLASAAARTETRGMHRRADHPDTDAADLYRVVVGGLDELVVATEPIAPFRQSGPGGDPAQ